MSYIAIDLETKGLIKNGVAPEIICVSAYDGDFVVWCKPWSDELREELITLSKDNVFIYHNSSFDNAVLRHHDVHVTHYEDTMIMSYVWDASRMSHSLASWGKEIGTAKLEKPWDGEHPLEWSEELYEYCLNDAKVTLELYHHLGQLLETDEQALRYYNTIELPFTSVIQEMEATGMYVDNTQMQEMLTTLQTRSAELKKELVSAAGLVPVEIKEYKKEHPDKKETSEWKFVGESDGVWSYQRYGEFNPASNKHKAYVLKVLCDWEPEEFTKTGEPMVSLDVLNKIQHSIADMLVEYSKLTKIITSFLLPFNNFMDVNHVLRGHFNQAVTITGRLSSSSPNLQNLPARGDLGKQLRNIITTPDESVVLFNGDLSNIEARVLAWMLYTFLGEDSLANIFINKQDFHSSNAAAWGVDRTAAKTLLFAILYGASAPRIAKTLKKSVSEAEELIARLNAALPAVEQMKQMVYETARESDGILHTVLGHRLHYPNINAKNKYKRARAERQLFNAFIQGSAGDIIKLLTLESMPHIYYHYGSLAVMVHDELLGYVMREEAEPLCSKLTDVFSSCQVLAPVPIEAEFHFGERWGDVKAA